MNQVEERPMTAGQPCTKKPETPRPVAIAMLYAVTRVASGNGTDPKPHFRGLFNTEDEAMAYVKADMLDAKADSKRTLAENFGSMALRTDDGLYGFEWNVEMFFCGEKFINAIRGAQL